MEVGEKGVESAGGTAHEFGSVGIECDKATAVVNPDRKLSRLEDCPELEAPECALCRAEFGKAFAEEFDVEIEMLHLVGDEFSADALDHGILDVAAQEGVVGFADDLGGYEELNFKLQINEAARPLENRVRPLFIDQGAAEVAYGFSEEMGVTLFLGHKEVERVVVIPEGFVSGKLFGIALQGVPLAGFPELEGRERAPKEIEAIPIGELMWGIPIGFVIAIPI